MSDETSVLADLATYHEGVRCVEMPCCGFTFDADHTDGGADPERYSCPQCAPPAYMEGDPLENAERLLAGILHNPRFRAFPHTTRGERADLEVAIAEIRRARVQA